MSLLAFLLGLAAASEPHTAAGRLVCLFYGLTALPAFIIFLLSTGGRLASALRLATVGLGRLCRRRQAWRQLWPDRPDGPGVPVWLPAVFLIIWVPLAAALLQLTGAASNYGEAVWIHLSALLSFGTAGRLSAAVRPVDFALRLTGLVLIAATVAVATDHIKAAEAQLAALVNGSYLAAISADGQMPPLRQIRTGLGRAARFWASLGNRRSAVELWRSRAQMQSAATQSRESSFSVRSKISRRCSRHSISLLPIANFSHACMGSEQPRAISVGPEMTSVA